MRRLVLLYVLPNSPRRLQRVMRRRAAQGGIAMPRGGHHRAHEAAVRCDSVRFDAVTTRIVRRRVDEYTVHSGQRTVGGTVRRRDRLRRTQRDKKTRGKRERERAEKRKRKGEEKERRDGVGTVRIGSLIVSIPCWPPNFDCAESKKISNFEESAIHCRGCLCMEMERSVYNDACADNNLSDCVCACVCVISSLALRL